jgi:excinuclease UvrABC ATPase subunit
LHPLDVENLLKVFDLLKFRNNTLIVIEHNLEVIAHADWIVDIGPNAGDLGGEVQFMGTPAEMIQNNSGLTAQYLKKCLTHSSNQSGQDLLHMEFHHITKYKKK